MQLIKTIAFRQPYTVYQETLTKGKFDEFDEFWPNRQTKTIQYKATIYRKSSIIGRRLLSAKATSIIG